MASSTAELKDKDTKDTGHPSNPIEDDRQSLFDLGSNPQDQAQEQLNVSIQNKIESFNSNDIRAQLSSWHQKSGLEGEVWGISDDHYSRAVELIKQIVNVPTSFSIDLLPSNEAGNLGVISGSSNISGEIKTQSGGYISQFSFNYPMSSPPSFKIGDINLSSFEERGVADKILQKLAEKNQGEIPYYAYFAGTLIDGATLLVTAPDLDRLLKKGFDFESFVEEDHIGVYIINKGEITKVNTTDVTIEGDFSFRLSMSAQYNGERYTIEIPDAIERALPTGSATGEALFVKSGSLGNLIRGEFGKGG